ncbi:hypothetical protein BDZ94DRAFT_1321239 [Collybia nuda]|uniref:Uncharacterized protein n=1 Tax=Collybia nuda TaxID=64659 RepID=A0A9P6CFH3_9AGAR|nr:hypothetical protein BDZ94DRAFT_1321239 [Collybia nuda]
MSIPNIIPFQSFQSTSTLRALLKLPSTKVSTMKFFTAATAALVVFAGMVAAAPETEAAQVVDKRACTPAPSGCLAMFTNVMAALALLAIMAQGIHADSATSCRAEHFNDQLQSKVGDTNITSLASYILQCSMFRIILFVYYERFPVSVMEPMTTA